MLKKIEVDTSFKAKAIKSRNSYMLWIPKIESELLSLKQGSYVEVGIKIIKKNK